MQGSDRMMFWGLVFLFLSMVFAVVVALLFG
jgi:hypothetical protein